MTTYLIFALGGLGTFALRISMIVGEGRLSGASWIHRHIALVSPVVLAAIVASGVLVSSGKAAMPNPVVLAAVAVGAYAVHRTNNITAALAIGLPIYWLGALAGFV